MTSKVAETFTLARWLFIRLVAISFFFAFYSAWDQNMGLIGSEGILPAGDFLSSVRSALGDEAYIRIPTIFWFIEPSDLNMDLLARAGMVLSLALFLGLCPPLLLLLLWFSYLSLSSVGQIFYSYQWDVLILEVAFFGAFLGPWRFRSELSDDPPPHTFPVVLMHLMLIKLMGLSGMAKLVSEDKTWHAVFSAPGGEPTSALSYHFETQPLPTSLSWYAHNLPEDMLWFGSAATLVIELLLPIFIVMPGRLRLIAFFPMALLQILIAATGNYCFFNILTLALCCLLISDQTYAKLRRRYYEPIAGRQEETSKIKSYGLGAVLAVYVLTSVAVANRDSLGSLSDAFVSAVRSTRTINTYGLFGNMTTARHEIIIEGSLDGEKWRRYDFRYKPGRVSGKMRYVAPYQPRLDWQIWFSALVPCLSGGNEWFLEFIGALFKRSDPVLDLLAANPFPDAPPKYIRSSVYRYDFSDPQSRRLLGSWWIAEEKGEYCPTLSLRYDPSGSPIVLPSKLP